MRPELRDDLDDEFCCVKLGSMIKSRRQSFRLEEQLECVVQMLGGRDSELRIVHFAIIFQILLQVVIVV